MSIESNESLVVRIAETLNDLHGWVEPPAETIATNLLTIIREAQEDAINDAVGAWIGGEWYDAYDRANLPQTWITWEALNVVDNWFTEYADKYWEMGNE